ncbi:MAG: Lrp/AsnC family transcriptional regulator [Chloroflexales bacterium]|nr:Lrp/AsnC family transcriptional regulator [Chloroflexales bacterium]
MNEIDETDLQILDLLQHDGRITHAELAQRVGLAAPTVQRRVRLLEERGYIKGYTAILNPLLLDLTVTGFIYVESNAGCDLDTLGRFLAGLPGVQEVYHLFGDWCFLIKVRTASLQSLERLVYQDLRKHPDVRRTQTTLSSSAALEVTQLPLPLFKAAH